MQSDVFVFFRTNFFYLVFVWLDTTSIGLHLTYISQDNLKYHWIFYKYILNWSHIWLYLSWIWMNLSTSTIRQHSPSPVLSHALAPTWRGPQWTLVLACTAPFLNGCQDPTGQRLKNGRGEYLWRGEKVYLALFICELCTEPPSKRDNSVVRSNHMRMTETAWSHSLVTG